MSEGAAGWDEPAAPDKLIDDDRGGPVHTPATAAGEGREDRERGGTQNGSTRGERRNHHEPLVSEGPQPQAEKGGGHQQQQNRTPVAGVHASPIHSNVSPLQKIAELHSGRQDTAEKSTPPAPLRIIFNFLNKRQRYSACARSEREILCVKNLDGLTVEPPGLLLLTKRLFLLLLLFQT